MLTQQEIKEVFLIIKRDKLNKKRIKELCESISVLIDELENTTEKAEINDILIDLDYFKDRLNEELNKI